MSTKRLTATAIHGGRSTSSSLPVVIPSGNGLVTAASSWSSRQTRDGNSNSGSTSFTILDCPAPVTPTAAALTAPAAPATPIRAKPNSRPLTFAG